MHGQVAHGLICTRLGRESSLYLLTMSQETPDHGSFDIFQNLRGPVGCDGLIH